MNGIEFDKKNHEFCTLKKENRIDFERVDRPLSIIAHVTRKCNLSCIYCSESEYYPDPSIEVLENVKNKLFGVHRIFLSGGDPLSREDIWEILDMYSDSKVLCLSTNCTLVTQKVAEKLAGKVTYVNTGLDGNQVINDKIRGGYKKIISGIRYLREANIEVSISTLVLKDNLDYLETVIDIAESLGVVKVRLALPFLKGRAKNLPLGMFVRDKEIMDKVAKIKKYVKRNKYRVNVKCAFWNSEVEGYALMVYPNQKVYAWPVFTKPDCVEYIGDLAREDILEVWEKYPYKENHINKYLYK